MGSSVVLKRLHVNTPPRVTSKKTMGFSPVDSAMVVAVSVAAGSLVAASLDDASWNYAVTKWDTELVTRYKAGCRAVQVVPKGHKTAAGLGGTWGRSREKLE